LQFFTFSKKLSAFSEVISSAKYDIIFFVLMFGFIIFGYSVAGYGIYGGVLYEFSTLYLASTQLLRTLLLDFNYSVMYQTDPTISSFYFVSYIIIFKIALLNMFVAIIVAHFNQFRRESGNEDNVSFLEVVLKILQNNLFKSSGGFTICGRNFDIKKLAEYLFGNPNSIPIGEDEYERKELNKDNTNGTLSLRVKKPQFNDYKLQFGMKSYFYEDLYNENSSNPLVVRNAGIYKRAEA
jgi:hypothetical protein